MLDALETINGFICEGQIQTDVDTLRAAIRHGMEADGWKFKVTARDTWSITPPKHLRDR